MTIRQDAARLFSNKIIGKTLPYPVNASPEMQEFVDTQVLPTGSSIASHQTAWTKFWMAFAKRYPEERSEQPPMTEQDRY